MQAWWAEDHSLKNIQNIRLLFKNSWLVVSVHLVVLDKVRQSSVFFSFKPRFVPIGPCKPLWTHLTWQKKKSQGTNLGFIKKCLHIRHSWCAHTLGYLDACLRSESLSSTLLIQPLSSPPSAWLFGPHHSPRSKPVLDKAAVKTCETRWGRSWGI